VADVSEVFRCAYCGQLTPLRNSTIWWSWVEELDDGTDLFAPAVYCSRYCGEQHTRGSVGRG
jgi:hypothetical protein